VLVRPGWFTVFSLYNVLAFTGAGLLWLRLRPSSRVGAMLLLLAVWSTVQSFQGSSSSLAFSVGVLADPVMVITWVYLLITFPTVKLSRAGIAVLAALIATIAVAFVPWFFFSANVAGATPLARCTAACPDNFFLIADRPSLAMHFADVEALGRMIFSVGCVALLSLRLLFATSPRRRVQQPIYVVAAFWAAAFGAYGVAVELIVTDPRVGDALGWFLTGMRLLIPLAFALSIIAARSFAGVALARMLSQLGRLPTAAALQRVTADALGDRELRLAFWSASGRSWIGVGGSAARPPTPGSGRAWREVRAEAGDARAALSYDEFLDEDPELLDAATSAVRLSLHARQLETELRQSHGLEKSALADDERRRIERDLHDGAQQRLVVIGMDIERLRHELPPEVGADAELSRLSGEVERALSEIREIAHGAYPAVLTDLGVRAALVEAVRGHGRTTLRILDLGRYPRAIEAAVYFAALEAIQNATKHAGPQASVTTSVWATYGQVWFEVRDDGCGFDPTALPGGGGLAGIARRLDAVGGTVDIVSAPGDGTIVVGCVPVD